MYKVIEVARILGVSKVTIYKKMDLLKKDLKSHVHKKKNVTFIDDEGVELIRSSISKGPVFVTSDIGSDAIDIKHNHIEDLNSFLVSLNNQIMVKKNQIEEKDRILNNMKHIMKETKARLNFLESKI